MSLQTIGSSSMEMVSFDVERQASQREGKPSASGVNLTINYPDEVMRTLFVSSNSTTPAEVSFSDCYWIDTFAPEPYRLKHPIRVKIVRQDDASMASHNESNIHASGDNDVEALDNLKSLILDTFDLLTSEAEDNLGPKPKHQLGVLSEYIERE